MRRPSTQLEHASCLGCGYALRELTTNTCPECGRGFDPGDPSTISLGNSGQVLSWLERTPIGWPMALAAAVPAAFFLYDNSSPGLDLSLICVLVPCFGVVCLWWLIRVIAQARFARQQWRRWLVVPIILFATAVLTSTDVPLRVRFWMSWPWFRQTTGKPSAISRIVGLYDIDRVDVRGTATLLYTGTSGLDDVGFIYLPDKSKSHPVGLDVALGGGWHVFHEPW